MSHIAVVKHIITKVKETENILVGMILVVDFS